MVFLKESFEELFNIMAASRKRCPWAKEMAIKEAAAFILAESKELLEEVETTSTEEMRDELGDILAVTMFFAVLAEEKGYFSIRDSLKNAVEKFKRRKPWIFNDMKVETAEEAMRLWNIAKQKEKEAKAANAVKKAKP